MRWNYNLFILLRFGLNVSNILPREFLYLFGEVFTEMIVKALILRLIILMKRVLILNQSRDKH